MCEFIARVVTSIFVTLIMSEFIVACFTWLVASVVSALAPQ